MRVLYSLEECQQTGGWVGLLALRPFQHTARAVACAHSVWHTAPSISAAASLLEAVY